MFAVWTQDLYIFLFDYFCLSGVFPDFPKESSKNPPMNPEIEDPNRKVFFMYSSNYHVFQGRAAKLRGHVVVTPAKHLLPPTPRVSVGKKDDPNSLGESLNDASPSRKNGYQEAFHCSGSA